jgi:ABC-type uncharacterized transport system auxiliary subunit
MPHARLLLALLALVPAGCISGRSPPARRFVLSAAAPAARAADAPAAGRVLRFRGVVAARSVDVQQAWRLSPEEVWLHELQRWSEPPADTLGRALARHLFEGEGLRRSSALAAPTLEVELRALEELRQERQVRVELGLLLVGEDGVARLERTWSRQAPVGGDEPEDAVRAYAALLGGLLPEVAREVARALAEG